MAMAEEHVHLRFDDRDGEPQLEPLAERLDATRFRLLYSPGLVYGIAAGDEFEITDDRGSFRVLKRSGNVVIRVFSEAPVQDIESTLVSEVVNRLGGRVDGSIARALALTIPVSAGFPEIEEAFAKFTAHTSGIVWEYGNVYDDSGSPLNWWVKNNAGH
jgi:hypothetical protein